MPAEVESNLARRGVMESDQNDTAKKPDTMSVSAIIYYQFAVVSQEKITWQANQFYLNGF